MPKTKKNKYKKILSIILALISLNRYKISSQGFVNEKSNKSDKLNKFNISFVVISSLVILVWISDKKQPKLEISKSQSSALQVNPATQTELPAPKTGWSMITAKQNKVPTNLLQNANCFFRRCKTKYIGKDASKNFWNQEAKELIKNPVGMHNYGNTCFFNSSLQILFRDPFFVRELFSMVMEMTGEELEIQSFCGNTSIKLFLLLLYQIDAAKERKQVLEKDPTLIKMLINLTLEDLRFSVNIQDDASLLVDRIFDKLRVELIYLRPERSFFRRNIEVLKKINTMDCLTDFGFLGVNQPETQKKISALLEEQKNSEYEERVIFSPDDFYVNLEIFKNFDGSRIKLKNLIELDETITLNTQVFSLKAVFCHAGKDIQSGHYYCCVIGYNGEWILISDSWIETIGKKLDNNILNEVSFAFYLYNKSDYNL
ncbi:MAG: ubiquitin carboxyl-terminal hydrolase [Oscillospiraceae bacterium]|jgi:ubiquitin C-terminal hydrolase|nr:ubiquitin carboxyl-terminal hydrolase [Oscillospiraceae bacterium]